jgi:hypothetical protein
MTHYIYTLKMKDHSFRIQRKKVLNLKLELYLFDLFYGIIYSQLVIQCITLQEFEHQSNLF